MISGPNADTQVKTKNMDFGNLKSSYLWQTKQNKPQIHRNHIYQMFYPKPLTSEHTQKQIATQSFAQGHVNKFNAIKSTEFKKYHYRSHTNLYAGWGPWDNTNW